MRNLEITKDLYYDYNLSQIYFDDNFKMIKNSDSFLYVDYGNLSSEFLKDEFFIIDYENTRKRDINKLKLELSNSYFIKDEYLKDLINEFLFYADLNDLEQLLNDYNISYKKAYDVVHVTGYSQGDNSQILINKKEYKKVTGNDFKEDDYQEYFNNLCYDAPITGNINISFDYTTKNGINHNFDFLKNDDDFYIDEILNNSYKLDFNYDYILKLINNDLIQYELNEDEKAEIINELKSIDYTDIKSNY
jgi:hypothetical protein